MDIGTRHRISLAIVLVTVLVLVSFAGCGGGDDDAASTTTAAVATTTTLTSEPTAPATPDGAVVIAHRGASGYAPEHTFAAYDLALEQGADYIEQDLQLTADGVLVDLHDDTLDRTARGPAESCTGSVTTKTLAQLRQCDFGSWFNEAHPDLADPAFVGLQIPTLEEILERYGKDVRYYIETKSPEAQPGMERALLDRLDASPLDVSALDTPTATSRPVIVQSFSAASLELVHSMRPGLPLVQLLPASGTPLDVATFDGIRAYAIGIGPSNANVDAALVDAAHSRCLDVHPYTVDDPVEMTRLLDAGVDGMFTNTPDRLRDLRQQHAAPPAHCDPAA